MRRRPDFLRNIVNRALADSALPRQVVEEIRQQVGRAEDRYRFHSFGGNIERLAEYIMSEDFDQLILALKSDRSGNGLKVLESILNEALQAYGDIPRVRKAIEARLQQLHGGTLPVTAKLETLLAEVKRAEKHGAVIRLDKKAATLIVEVPGILRVEVAVSDSGELVATYTLKARARHRNVAETAKLINRLVEAAAGIRDSGQDTAAS